MGGLRADLAVEVHVYRPQAYAEAIDLARLREDHLNATRKANRPKQKRSGVGTIEPRNNT